MNSPYAHTPAIGTMGGLLSFALMWVERTAHAGWLYLQLNPALLVIMAAALSATVLGAIDSPAVLRVVRGRAWYRLWSGHTLLLTPRRYRTEMQARCTRARRIYLSSGPVGRPILVADDAVTAPLPARHLPG